MVYKSKPRARRPVYRKPVKRTIKKKSLKNIVSKMIKANAKKTLEVKKSVFTSDDGVQVAHNNFVTLDNNILSTSQGTGAGEATIFNNRIGDRITLRGIKLTMMIELNERYSDVTFRLLVIKCAKGDIPTRATLFNNISGNKMLDTINKERYTILHSKIFKIKAPNIASNGVASGGALTGAGTFDMLNGQQTLLSRGTRIVKAWLPYKAFSKSGVITYEDGSSQVKFFDYRVVLYAYSNYSTLQDVFNVGRVNDYIKQTYFTDA